MYTEDCADDILGKNRFINVKDQRAHVFVLSFTNHEPRLEVYE